MRIQSSLILITLNSLTFITTLWFCPISRSEGNHTSVKSLFRGPTLSESKGQLSKRELVPVSPLSAASHLDVLSSLAYEVSDIRVASEQTLPTKTDAFRAKQNYDSSPFKLTNLELTNLKASSSSPELQGSMRLEGNSLENNSLEGEFLIAQGLTTPPETEAGSRPRLRTTPSSPDQPIYRPRSDVVLKRRGRYGPGIGLFAPTAFGKQFRQFSVGFGFQERVRFFDADDGAFGVGFGLGDADEYVALDVGLTLTNVSDPFDRGFFHFKLHRRLPEQFAVAVGVNDVLNFGGSDLDGPSPYGVVSKVINLKDSTDDFFSRVYLSLGVGTGRYRTEANIFADDEEPGVFGGVAVRVADPVSVITEWSGQDLSVGVSLRPIRNIPLIITPAVTDITGAAGDGARFVFGVGYVFEF